MVIGFKPYMKPLILAQTKIHTIREDAHDRWKPGMTMHMATGVRTRHYHNFNTTPLISTQTIEIRHSKTKGIAIVIDEQVFWHEETQSLFGDRAANQRMRLLANQDGFDTTDDFFQWFNKPFTGKILHWTNYKYIWYEK